MIRIAVASLISILVITCLGGCSLFGIRSGYEQLEYTVVEKIGDIEIRQYSQRVAAQADGMKSDNDAFRALFRYISGDNASKESVSMTAPVEVDASKKITMTSPVEIEESDGAVSMKFFLPRSYTMSTAPKPTDAHIKIVELSAEKFAVLTYSGLRTEGRFEAKSSELLKALADSRWKPQSVPLFLGYDPPFTIPFLRRNEVVVKVARME